MTPELITELAEDIGTTPDFVDARWNRALSAQRATNGMMRASQPDATYWEAWAETQRRQAASSARDAEIIRAGAEIRGLAEAAEEDELRRQFQATGLEFDAVPPDAPPPPTPQLTLADVHRDLAGLEGPVRDAWRRADDKAARRICREYYERVFFAETVAVPRPVSEALACMLTAGRLPAMVAGVTMASPPTYTKHAGTWADFERVCEACDELRYDLSLTIVGRGWWIWKRPPEGRWRYHETPAVPEGAPPLVSLAEPALKVSAEPVTGPEAAFGPGDILVPLPGTLPAPSRRVG